MKILTSCYAFLTVLCLSLPLFSQPSWKKTYPQPITGWLTQTKFFDHNNGYIVAGIYNQTFLYKTNDATVTWVNDSAFFQNNGQYLLMNDIKSGWLLTASGYIMHTNDSGNSYTLSDPTVHSLYTFAGCLTDSVHAWFLLNSDSVIFTQDGGQSWNNIVIDPFITTQNIYFLNNQKGWVFSDNGIYLTNDGGFTWTPQGTPPGYRLTSMDFADSLNGIAVGYKTFDEGIILRTINGGINWIITDTTQSGLGKIKMINDSHAIAFGSDYSFSGNIIYSSDTGNTWATVYSNELYSMSASDFTMCDSGLCYIVSRRGGILQSLDFGLTWNPISKTINGGQLIDEMVFVDSLNGFILDSWVSGDHKMYKTNDGGVSWQLLSSNMGSSFAPRHFCFISNDTGWVAAADTGGWKIAKTVDGGNNYTVQYVNPSNLSFIKFNNSHHGIAGGFFGEILYTFDGGNNWALGSLPPSQNQVIVRNIFVLNDSIDWVIVQRTSSPFDHYIFQTTDGGVTWNIKYHNTDIWQRPLKLFFVDELLGYCIKSSNPFYPNLYKTVDGGTSWVHLPINNLPQNAQDYVLLDMYFSDALNGLFAGGSSGSLFNQGAFILKTSDGGNTFNIEYADTACWSLTNISFIDTSTLFAAGYFGLFVSKSGNVITTNQIETESPPNNLSISIFPNPTNDLCTISANDFCNAVLSIYDIIGRKLLIKPFDKTITLNTQQLTSGIYFVELRNKKEVILKGKLIKN